MTLKMSLQFNDRIIEIIDSFTIIPKLGHDIIFGDGLINKTGLLHSNIAEIQQRLDLAGSGSEAQFQICNLDYEFNFRPEINTISSEDLLCSDLSTLQLKFQGELIRLHKLEANVDDDPDLPTNGLFPENVQPPRSEPIAQVTASPRLTFRELYELAKNNRTQFDEYKENVQARNINQVQDPLLAEIPPQRERQFQHLRNDTGQRYDKRPSHGTRDKRRMPQRPSLLHAAHHDAHHQKRHQRKPRDDAQGRRRSPLHEPTLHQPSAHGDLCQQGPAHDDR